MMKKEQKPYKVIAYVTAPAADKWRWIGKDLKEVISDVDTAYVSHINYAFGMLEVYQFDKEVKNRPMMEGGVVSKEAYKNPKDNQYHYKACINGWIEEMGMKIEGEKYLKALVKLKEKKSSLKILLSIGGWKADGFCYMARTKESRREFIHSCIDLIEEYHLDGIDLDWEYPTKKTKDIIATCDHCTEDARKLLKELRESLNLKYIKEYKLLTIASGDPWVDKETFQALDYMNVMCYDYWPGSGKSQASFPFMEYYMKLHLDMVGDTLENRLKLNLGVPFYNEGGVHLVPYYKEWSGYVDVSPSIIKRKMKWVKKKGYGGGFYWNYAMDIYKQDVKNPRSRKVKILQRTLYHTLNRNWKDILKKYN